MNLRLTISAVLGMTFASAGYSTTYNCSIYRHKGNETKLIKQFDLVAVPKDIAFQIVPIEGTFAALCDINQKDPDPTHATVECSFGTPIQRAIGTNKPNLKAIYGDLIVTASTDFGNKSVFTSYISGEYTNTAGCHKTVD
jgi:hypothetical protein